MARELRGKSYRDVRWKWADRSRGTRTHLARGDESITLCGIALPGTPGNERNAAMLDNAASERGRCLRCARSRNRGG